MFDAYRVAVKLSLVNHVSTGLAAISAQLNQVNGGFRAAQAHATAFERKLLDIKRMGLIGGGMAALGFGGLSLMKGPLDAAKDYETAFARFKTLNLGKAVNDQANAFALGTKTFGASSKDLMETLRESVGMFGGIDKAMAIAPKLAELNAANGVLFGGKGGKIDSGAVRSVMRFNDMRGLTNTPEDFMRGLDLAQKMVTGSGGAMKFQDLEQMAKRGGAAFKGLSDDGVMMMATIAQEQGGASTGTALMSLYQNLIAGRTTKKTMAALSDAGLATLGSVSHGTVGGRDYRTTQITSIKGEELLRTNPGAWLMQYVVPAAQKAGAKTDSEVIAFANNLISNRTGSSMAATFTTQQLEAMRDFRLVKNAMGVDGTINASKGTLAGREANLQAKWQNSMQALGTAILPLAIKMVDGLTSALESFTSFAREYPTTMRILTGAFIGLAGAMAFGGTVMLLKAGFGALSVAIGVAGGTAGLVGALGAVLSPIGLAVLALGTLAAAAYAFRPMSQAEVDAAKTEGGVRLTPGAAARAAEMGWETPTIKFRQNPYGRSTRAGPGAPPSKAGPGQMINNTIVMPNGEVLAKVVTKNQEQAMARPQSGTSFFDGSMDLRVPGFSGVN